MACGLSGPVLQWQREKSGCLGYEGTTGACQTRLHHVLLSLRRHGLRLQLCKQRDSVLLQLSGARIARHAALAIQSSRLCEKLDLCLSYSLHICLAFSSTQRHIGSLAGEWGSDWVIYIYIYICTYIRLYNFIHVDIIYIYIIHIYTKTYVCLSQPYQYCGQPLDFRNERIHTLPHQPFIGSLHFPQEGAPFSEPRRGALAQGLLHAPALQECLELSSGPGRHRF